MSRRRLALILLACVVAGVLGFILFNIETTPTDAFVGAFSACTPGDLELMIRGSDAPFTVTGNGPGLPATLPAQGPLVLPGPAIWTNLVVTNAIGESSALGTRQCPFPNLAPFAMCRTNASGTYLEFSIFGGEGPFEVTGTGPGLPFTTPLVGTFNLPGPAEWLNLTVTELGGNYESMRVGNYACGVIPSTLTPTPRPTPVPEVVSVGSTCLGADLYIMVMNVPYQPASRVTLIGTGPGLENGPIDAPLVPNARSVVFSLVGPGTWSNLAIHPQPPSLFAPISIATISCPLTPSSPPDVPTDVPTDEAPDVPTNAPTNAPSAVVPPAFTTLYGIPRVMHLPASQPQWVYDAPNGHQIMVDGVPLRLPNDADANGFDTLVVLDVLDVDGTLWVALDLGGDHPGYIRWPSDN